MHNQTRRTISVAIPTYNRTELTIEAIKSVLSLSACGSLITEIVVMDDGSTYENQGALHLGISELDIPNSGLMIRTLVSDKNLGVYHAKIKAVRHCSNDWVILLDSDNKLTEDYIKAIEGEKIWMNNVVYCPDFAMPIFDYTSFGGLVISRVNVAALWREKRFDCLMNTMNYFLNKYTWLDVMPIDVPPPKAADSIFMNLQWLKAGNYMSVLKGMRYHHLIHDGSNYQAEEKDSRGIYKQVVEELKSLR